jgi:hypothetical protein
MVQHVLGAEQAYLSRLAWRLEMGEEQDLARQLERTRRAVLEALESAALFGWRAISFAG